MAAGSDDSGLDDVFADFKAERYHVDYFLALWAAERKCVYEVAVCMRPAAHQGHMRILPGVEHLVGVVTVAGQYHLQ